MVAKYGMKWILVALLASGALAVPVASQAQLSVSITLAPPPLPVYEQPEIPAPGYLWTPGYWAYGPEGYFWVPGTWVEPPSVGLLWTPGYWGWSAGLFLWNAGYWGPQVGFYGGVNYGFGYGGHGYEGGYWRNNQFYYNREVTRINDVHITNVYNKTVVNNVTVQRVSYVGGPGGVAARPTAQEQQAAHLQHVPPTSVQTQHRESAATHHELLASVNQGKPAIAATAKPGDFSAHVVPANRAGGPMPVPVHARDLPKAAPMAPVSETASQEEKNQARDSAAMQARHDQEREDLAKQQEQDHAKMAAQPKNSSVQPTNNSAPPRNNSAQPKNNAAQAKNDQAMANLERQHQQQTQQLQQRHMAEQQQQHAPPPQQVAHSAPPAHAAPPPPPPAQQHPQGGGH